MKTDELDPKPLNLKIEKGIPIPRRKELFTRAKFYCIDQLKEGQSFFIPGEHFPSVSALTSTCYYYGKNAGAKFAIRKWEENGKLGARVWRTK